MARSSSRGEWERLLAAQRREDYQQARERARQAREQEKADEQEHLEAQQRTADEKTAEIERQITTLDEVLTSALSLPPLTFERLMELPKAARFDPGPLGLALPPPEWNNFAPIETRGLRRFLDGFGRRGRQLASARALFAAAQLEHRQKESAQQHELAAAKTRHDQQVTEERSKAAGRNSYIRSRQSSFAAGDPESVEWFVSCVLHASRYPEGFPREYKVSYHPQNRDITVELELPSQSVIPSARACRYVKGRDVVEQLPRPDNEIEERYERLISAVALRTLHEVFDATPSGLIEAITFIGRVTTVDRATGRSTQPRLLSVSADRSEFDELVLAAVDPVACLAYLNALEAPIRSHVQPSLVRP